MAIGSPVGGTGGVRGGVRGGGGSRDGSEREEGARPREPRRVGAAASSAVAVGLLLWAHPPAGADGESHRVAIWCGGRRFVPEEPPAWSGLVLLPLFLTRDGAVRAPHSRPRVVSSDAVCPPDGVAWPALLGSCPAYPGRGFIFVEHPFQLLTL